MIPKHVAIIMDGNGRWAKAKGHPRVFGHIHGASKLKAIIRECGVLGIKHLTLFAFSSENWGRPSDEVQVLMKLLCKYLKREQKTLMKDQVRFKTIGEIKNLPEVAQNIIQETVEMTSLNTGLELIFALSYGSRNEILNAVKEVLSKIQSGDLNSSEISVETFSRFLFTKDIPDPDLIIRTSGEQRLSNFLLWQSAYSEFYFTEVFWPEFSPSHLREAIKDYAGRKRRYGLVESSPS